MLIAQESATANVVEQLLDTGNDTWRMHSVEPSVGFL
jgi:hypothetical protein